MAGSKFGSFKSEKGDSAAATGPMAQRRDPYEALGVGRNATECLPPHGPQILVGGSSAAAADPATTSRPERRLGRWGRHLWRGGGSRGKGGACGDRGNTGVCMIDWGRKRRGEMKGAAKRPLRLLALPSPCCRLLCFLLLLLSAPLLSPARGLEMARALSVGEELVGETMPLRHGLRLYRLAWLRPSAWYEVKISYPASIPSSFTIRLVDDTVAAGVSKSRRLLNTEKIIFKAQSSKPVVYVLVTVEPEGVVAKPNVPERELVLFNIACDELMLGIPHFAWWVGIAALLCIVLALLAPHFLPLRKLLNYEAIELSDTDAAKLS